MGKQSPGFHVIQTDQCGDIQHCVLSRMYRKLLFDNWNNVWNIKILLISLRQESPKMLFVKFSANW